jgi:serine phosphatase RsbU (regulator of sigma subunit)
MAASLASFRSTVRHGFGPRELLKYLDRALSDYTKNTNQNCAFIYAELTPPLPPSFDQGLLRVANAGGISPIIKRVDGSIEWVQVGGLPLGVAGDLEFDYQEQRVPLTKGDMIVLISDGVIEAQNAERQMFGFTQFEQAIATGPTHSPSAMLEHIKNEVATFSAGAEPHDDLTMVIIRV